MIPRLVYYTCVYFDGRVVGDYDFRIKEGEEEIKDRKCSLNRFVTLNSEQNFKPARKPIP